MHLKWTDEEQMMRKMVRDFTQKEVAPLADNIDETDTYPVSLIRKMGSLGLMGIPIPEEHGGAGMDFTSYIIAIHELSKVSATMGVILSVHTSVGTHPILSYGNEQQKNAYVPKLASGELVGAFGLTEPGAGSDAAALSCRAKRDGHDYILNGSKVFITNGEAADTFVVFATLDPDQGKDAITAFIVEKGMSGFTVTGKERKMGLNGSGTVGLQFDDARVPAANRLGREGEGFQIAMSNLNIGRIGIAAQALGIAEGALEYARDYAQKRWQFGKSISKQQGIGFKLADMSTQIEAARLLVYQAAALVESDITCTKEASMAKLLASQTAVSVTTEAIQVLGGYGYTKDYPVERFFRDAKVTEIYEGTSEIQRIVIGRELTK
ncbi:acyl-CoA dehydrogenase [Tuberibacillus sp. Marseille-P3662]|uniref:acyl-CoA dehydrogenase n=1 Tax=Tuberibacillus sp. Marseille-P3662 TaxID=1965358 RepID=UPI000A1C92BC|nr:acyl-CoA dehydrogenase [Tuberibacillus sp. Marseille-P3662]